MEFELIAGILKKCVKSQNRKRQKIIQSYTFYDQLYDTVYIPRGKKGNCTQILGKEPCFSRRSSGIGTGFKIKFELVKLVLKTAHLEIFLNGRLFYKSNLMPWAKGSSVV